MYEQENEKNFTNGHKEVNKIANENLQDDSVNLKNDLLQHNINEDDIERNNSDNNYTESNNVDKYEKESKNNNNESYYITNQRNDRRKRGFASYVLVAVIASLIGGIITSYIAPKYLYGNIIPVPEIYKEQKSEGSIIKIEPKDDLTTVSAVAEKSMKSVVGITTVEETKDLFGYIREAQGVGSGVIVDSNGYILTNSHVIADGKAKTITVQFEDGTKKEAKVLWVEPSMDLAVIKVDATGLPAADLGDSDELVVGELVVAIGNPLGLQFQRTVTSGIISGLDRTINADNIQMDELLQTDASINPGNSGGPLLNSKGEVIGINTAKITTAEGLGFSIPINAAKSIVQEVIEHGSIKQVYVGIRGINVEQYEKQLNIDIGLDSGIVILEVTKDSPAALTQLKANDIIVSIDEVEITNMVSLKKALYQYKPGDKAVISIIRDGKKIEKTITFKEKPENL